jgi:hypothetical protein
MIAKRRGRFDREKGMKMSFSRNDLCGMSSVPRTRSIEDRFTTDNERSKNPFILINSTDAPQAN